MPTPASAARDQTGLHRAWLALRAVLVLAGFGAFMCLQACQAAYVTHSREVTATAYTLRPSETRSQGKKGVGAWGYKLKAGVQVIAVSRDLLDAGLKPGSKVWIDGLDGTWVVRDKMNRRWKNRIDIFMGTDVDAAREWGRRKVTIRWYTPRER